ncbi:hypothetical protein [Stutzerimonas stutzeri]|uniref:hypothetical protein n=1 Tax=Stutzerimonas stutzeri TaxID=316 RepID=UPI003AF34C04
MMARSRNIKPGFFQNEDLQELDFATRLFFIGLWTEADKEGRLEDRPKKLKNALFPADDVEVEQMLDGLAAYGFISRYERAGKKIIQIVKWAKHQNPHRREAPSTLPAETDEVVEEEQQAESGPQKADTEAAFETFWKLYPRKCGKEPARKAFAKINPSPELLAQMVESLAKHCASTGWTKDDGQFIPHASTWLNQKRWNDEVKPAGNVHQFPGASRHTGFDQRDYKAGLTEREDGTYGF